MRTHDPLCRLLRQESCSGVGGSDWGHYTDRDTCRNCGTECDCERIRELRTAFEAEIRRSEVVAKDEPRCAHCGSTDTLTGINTQWACPKHIETVMFEVLEPIRDLLDGETP